MRAATAALRQGEAFRGAGSEPASCSFSCRFASSHSASISAKLTEPSGFPCRSSSVSIKPKRLSNLALVLRSALSGSDPECRARLATAKRRSPISACTPAASPASSAASISPVSSRILARTCRASFQSNPTLPALDCSLMARVSAGRARGTSASSLVSAPSAAPRFAAFSSAFISAHRA